MPTLEPARAHSDEGDAVAVSLVHAGLDLEHQAREGIVQRPAAPVGQEAGCRAGDEVDHAVEQEPHAEVGQRRAEEHRRRFAGKERLAVDDPTQLGEQLRFFECRCPRTRPPRRAARSTSMTSSGAMVEPRAVRSKRVYSPVPWWMTPRKSPGIPTGQVTGVGSTTRVSSIWSSSSRGTLTRPIELVDEGEERDLPLAADLEELERLWFDALGGVDAP